MKLDIVLHACQPPFIVKSFSLKTCHRNGIVKDLFRDFLYQT